MLSVCRSITPTTGLFNSSRWRKGMMELLQSWNTTVLVLQQNTFISSPRLLFLLPWSNTNSGLSFICRMGSEDSEGREGEQSLSMCTRVPVAVWYHLSPLQCSHDMQNLLSSLVFFPFQYLFIFFTAPAASIRGLDGNLGILFCMWCLLSRLCSCLTCFILCKKADVL